MGLPLWAATRPVSKSLCTVSLLLDSKSSSRIARQRARALPHVPTATTANQPDEPRANLASARDEASTSDDYSDVGGIMARLRLTSRHDDDGHYTDIHSVGRRTSYWQVVIVNFREILLAGEFRGNFQCNFRHRRFRGIWIKYKRFDKYGHTVNC